MINLVAFREHLRDLSPKQAVYQVREGFITADQYRVWSHAWQTFSHRFELRYCHCDVCKAAFPTPEYSAVSTYEWSL